MIQKIRHVIVATSGFGVMSESSFIQVPFLFFFFFFFFCASQPSASRCSKLGKSEIGEWTCPDWSPI